MKRREFITLLGGAAAAWPLAARAQQPAMPVIGFLNGASPGAWVLYTAAFRQGFKEAGFVEGQNAAIEYRWAEGQYDRLPSLAADLVQQKVTVIAATSTPAALAAKAATSTVPIVFTTGGDPIKLGLVASLSRPGGNVTGSTNFSVEVGPKRLELARELFPGATTFALLVNPASPLAATVSKDLQAVADTLGVRLHVLHASTEADFEAAFATAARLRAAALVIGSADPWFNSHAAELGALALRHSVPAIFQYREFAAAGGLMSYGGRRNFLHLAVGAAALPAVMRTAWAQAYPARPVRIVVGFTAGGAGDITARLIGQWLSERLGQQFVIDNRPGGGTNIGTEAVVRSPPDGYTLLLVNSSNTINATLYDKLNFDFIRDIAPISEIARFSFVMEVSPSVPTKTLPEFIAYAKANPGKINMASAGSGSTHHVAGELFKMMAGVEMVHVPYRGSPPALTDLLAGQVQVMFDATPSSLPHIRAGKLRPLAVTTATRLEVLPDVPTVGGFVPGYEASSWLGFGAPKNTPAAVVDRLNKEINLAISDSAIKARLVDLGGLVLPPSSPAEFGKFLASDTEKWARVIRTANIKPE
jgi:tripartite-type tricarboxylate transporter receptor subunit TctC/ABC-type uncharacterized transport system substrate-binding protein